MHTKLPRPLRAALRQMLPSPLGKALLELYILPYRGRRYECPVCGGRWRRMWTQGRKPRRDARCPRCGSLERHRLHWLYFQTTGLFRERLRMLHMAPERAFHSHFRQMQNLHYITGDLFADNVNTRLDITRLPFADGSFDVILCSHVLEHIPDDAAAMRELRRVLRPGGWALLEVPLDKNREQTYEDPAITSPEERLRAFGQEDHVRVYGRDYRERLEAAGFKVREDDFYHRLTPEQVQRHRLLPHTLHICTRD